MRRCACCCPPPRPPTRSDQVSPLHAGGGGGDETCAVISFSKLDLDAHFSLPNSPAGRGPSAPRCRRESGGRASAREWGSEPALRDPPPRPLPGELCGEGTGTRSRTQIRPSLSAGLSLHRSLSWVLRGAVCELRKSPKCPPLCAAARHRTGFSFNRTPKAGCKHLRVPEVTWAAGTSQQSHPLPAPPPQAVLGLCCREGVGGWFSV